MSVAVPVIDFIDPTVSPRLIYLKVGVREYHPIDDIYTEVRNLRRTDETMRPHDPFVTGGGNIKKQSDGSKRTPRYAVFNNCKVVPDRAVSHDLTVTGEQLYANAFGEEPVGSGAAVMDKGPLPVGVDVNVDYAPSEAEVIVLSTGSGLSTAQDASLTAIETKVNTLPTAAEIADAVWNAEIDDYLTTGTMGEGLAVAMALVADTWQFHGLDITNPATVTDGGLTAGGVELVYTDDGTTTTAQRQ